MGAAKPIFTLVNETCKHRKNKVGSLLRVQALGDFFLLDGALLDEFPHRLGDIDGGGTGAGADATIEDQIHAAIHHAENFDSAATRRMARNVSAGGDERLV